MNASRSSVTTLAVKFSKQAEPAQLFIFIRKLHIPSLHELPTGSVYLLGKIHTPKGSFLKSLSEDCCSIRERGRDLKQVQSWNNICWPVNPWLRVV